MFSFEVDSLGIAAFAASLPERICAPLSRDVPVVGDGPVVLIASGALAKAADLIVAWHEQRRTTPIIAISGPVIPGFVDASTTVIAVALAGDTPETLEAATTAKARGARVHGLCVAGPLVELAAASGGTHVGLDASVPGPRWAFYDVVRILANMIDPQTFERDVDGLFDHLEARRNDAGDSSGVLSRIDRAIDRRFALFCGAGPMLSVIARRIKAQVNENAKSPAFASPMPAAVYDEIAGFGQQGDVTRQVLSVIELRGHDDSAIDMVRFDARRPLLDEVVASMSVLVAKGNSPLARALDVSLAGDYLSLLLAKRAGVDPGPVPAIVEIKAAVAATVSTGPA